MTPAEQLDALRAEVSGYFAKLPEPPVYMRRQDPLRETAKRLFERGQALQERVRKTDPFEAVAALDLALSAHLEVLGHLQDGRVTKAEDAWRKALMLEQNALSARRLWSRSDEQRGPVFDPKTRASRYDAKPDATVKVTLACAYCHQSGQYSFSPHQTAHLFTCAACKHPFEVWFGELRELRVERLDKHRRYHFRVDALAGGTSGIHFEDVSAGELFVAPRDLLAFLYRRPRDLVGVLDLNSGKVLWVQAPSACFVATVAFGAGAPELEAFRAFRDEVLSRTAPGRALIARYYRHGPGWAGWLERHPRLRQLTRAGLKAMHRLL